MHKKTIRKGGREFGPYFYTTARDKRGRVRTHYLGIDEDTAREKEKKILLSYKQKRHFGLKAAGSALAALSRLRPFSSKSHARMLAPALLILATVAIISLSTLLPEIPLTAEKPIVEIRTASEIQMEPEVIPTPSGNFDLVLAPKPREPQPEKQEEPAPMPRLEIQEISDPPPRIESRIDTYTGPQPEHGRINTQVLAVKQELEFQEALVTLPKTGPVNTIMRCSDFDFEAFTCPAWEKTDIPFQETQDSITFRVARFSAYGGAIINITKADHLDENRSFLSSVFQEVRTKDDIWSEPIPPGHYVRAVFETPLDSTRDITIYARSTDLMGEQARGEGGSQRGSGPLADIEVYTKDSSDLIAIFENISGEDWHRVYLTNLNGAHDTFDLKIKGSPVQFDYIVDPVIEIDEEKVTTDSLLADVVAETGSQNFTHLSIDRSAGSIYENLTFYMPFDADKADTKGATHYDFTEYNNDGTGAGDAVVNSTSCMDNHGNCLQLDVNDGYADYVNLSDVTFGLGATNQITVMAWARRASEETYYQVIAQRAQYSNPFSLRTRGDSGKVGVRLIIKADSNINLDSASTPIGLGEWAHYAGTYNGTGMSVYINGVPDGSAANTGALDINAGDDVHIGSSPVSTNDNFSGQIDEVMIFNTSLTTAQIAAIYYNQSPRFVPNGTQRVRAVNITNSSDWNNNGFNRVNLSTTFERNLSSNISARIGQINLSVNNSGLILYMPFEWGSAVDISGRGNDGIIPSQTYYRPLFNETGGLNETGGFEFDGSDAYITFNEYYTNLTAFTLAAWAKPDNQDDSGYIIYGQGNGEQYILKQSSTSSGKWAFTVNCGPQSDDAESNGPPVAGKWQHIVGVLNGTSINTGCFNIYVNGVKQSDFFCWSIKTCGYVDVTSMLIGDQLFSFDGMVDEVMIFNRTLSQAEITALYNNQSQKHNVPYYTAYQNLTGTGQNTTFTIDTEADFIFPDFEFLPGNTTSNPFYTPLLIGDIVLDAFSVDVTHPSGVGFLSPTPSNDTNLSQNNYFVNVSFSDASPDWCELELTNSSGTINYTMSQGANNSEYNFNVTGNSDHSTYSYAYCNDSVGNWGGSSARHVRTDTTAPANLTYTSPSANNTNTSSNTVEFNFTVWDNLEESMGCTLYINDSVNDTLIGASNNSLTNQAGWTLWMQDGTYVWNITCNDSAGNINDSAGNWTLAVDTTAPSNIGFMGLTPANDTNLSQDNYYINVSFIESNLDICLLELYNATYASGQNFTMTEYNSTSCIYNVTGQSDYNTYFYAYINDTIGNLGRSSARHVTLDTTLPNAVGFLSPTPSNDTNLSQNNYFVNISFNDTHPESCLLELTNSSGTINYTMSQGANQTEYYLNATGQTDFASYFYAYCNDTSNNWGGSSARHVRTDTTAPANLTYTAPGNSTNTNSNTVEFNFTVWDNLESSMSCSLYLNGNPNSSLVGVSNNSLTDQAGWNLGLPEGTWIWNVTCNDSAGNANTAAGNYTLRVDTTYPSIVYNTSTESNNANLSRDNIFVNITAVDSANNVSAFIDFDDSLVSWWRMDDVNTTAQTYKVRVVDYMDRNNGTAAGDAHQVSNGYLGKGFEFDGSGDSIDTGLDVSWNNTNEVTWSFWIKPNSVSGIDNDAFLGKKYAEWEWTFYHDNATARFVYWDPTGFYNNGMNADWGNVLTAGSWTHLVYVWNKTDSLLYADGDITNTHTATDPSINQNRNNQVMVGGNIYAEGADEYFNGTIDDVMIFNRSLSAEEIVHLYANQSSQYLERDFTSLADGTHTFQAYAQDIAGNVNNTAQRTVIIDSVAPDSVGFLSPTPSNDTNLSQNNYFVNVSFNDTYPESCLLELTNSSGTINYTMSQGANTTEYNINVTGQIDYASYLYAYCNDTSNNWGGSSARHVTLDTTPPNAVGFLAPTPSNDTNLSQNNYFVNASFNDTHPESCLLELTNSSGTINYTMSQGANNSEYNFNVTGNSDHSTYSYAYCNDSVGNWGGSSARHVTIDTTAPSGIGFIGLTPANDTNLSQDNYYINVSFTDATTGAGTCMLELTNGTGTVNYTMANYNSTSCIYNVTGQTDDYREYFYAYVTDTAGNLGRSSARHVTIDTTAPDNVGFLAPTPANNTNLPQDNYFVNASFNDTHPESCLLELTNSSGTINYTMSQGANTTEYNINVTGQTDFASYLYAYCNDTSGNWGRSGQRFVLTDTAYPSIVYNTSTESDNANLSRDNIFVNITAVDSANNVSTFIDYDNSLVGWWRFDDVNSTGDPTDYMDRNNGTAVNAVQVDNGYFGKGFEFDGDGDYVETTNSSDFDATDKTVSFWMKPNDIAFVRGLVTKHSSSGSTGTGYFILQSSNDLSFYVYNSSEDRKQIKVNNVLSTDVWVHIAMVFNDTKFEAYVDGSSRAIDDLEGFSPAPAQKLTIGKYSYASSYYFNGTIDDVMIFNRSLSAEEIVHLYANQSSQYLERDFTSLADGTHTFQAYAQDIAGNVNNTAQRTVIIDSVAPDSVGFLAPTPSNDTNLSQDNYFINVSFNDTHPESCLLELTNSSGTINYTMSQGANTTEYNINVTGQTDFASYLYAYCNDTSNNWGGSSARHVTLDTTPPNAVGFLSPTPSNDTNLSQNNYFVNISFNDTHPESCLLELTNSSGTINYTMSQGANQTEYYLNATGQTDYASYLYAYCNDTSNNWGGSSARHVTLDTLAPDSVGNLAPTPPNNTALSQDNYFINVSFNDTNPGWCTLELTNNSGTINYTMSRGANSSEYSFNVTGQEEFITYFFAYCNDTAGNLNMSSTATFVILDVGPPSFTTYRTNSTPNEDQDAELNVTLTYIGAPVDTVIIEVQNNTDLINYTVPNHAGLEYYFILTQGNYTAHDEINWTWYSNDTANNLGKSTLQTFTVANQPPTHDNPILNTTTDLNRTNDNIHCYNISTAELDAEDPATVNQIKWYKGHAEQTSLENASTVTSGNTSDDEDWICEITPHDTYGSGTEKNSTALTILNSEPEHSSPILNATSAGNYTTDNLQCWNVSTSDNDTSDTVRNIVRWYQNNSKKDTLENFTNVSWGNTSLDDNWICEVIPFDGTDNGTARNSTALAIRNMPPNITAVYANPTIIERNGTNQTTLWLNFSEYDDLAGPNYPAVLWVRAMNGSVYGPYTNTSPTRFADYNYSATYTLDPDSYWLPGTYDINASLTDRSLTNYTEFDSHQEEFTVLGYLDKLYFISPALNETHDMDENIRISMTLYNLNSQALGAHTAGFWANTTWAYGFSNLPYNYTGNLANSSNEYNHTWNVSDYHGGNWSLYGEANLSYYYNVTNTTWFWINHTIEANITALMTNKTSYGMNEDAGITGNITRKGNVEINGSLDLYVRRVSENESVCMIVSNPNSLHSYEAFYNSTLSDEGFNITVFDDEEVNAGTWTPQVCDVIFWGQSNYDSTWLQYMDDRILAQVQGGKPLVATYYGLIQGLRDMNISLASGWGGGFGDDLNASEREHALTGNYTRVNASQVRDTTYNYLYLTGFQGTEYVNDNATGRTVLGLNATEGARIVAFGLYRSDNWTFDAEDLFLRAIWYAIYGSAQGFTNIQNQSITVPYGSQNYTNNWYNISYVWETAQKYPGQYRAEAWFSYRDQDNVEHNLTETYTFSIAPVENASPSVTLNASSTAGTDDVNVIAYINCTGNKDLTGNITIRVYNSTGNLIKSLASVTNQVIRPDANYSNTVAWNTGYNPTGIYSVRANYTWASGSVQGEANLTITAYNMTQLTVTTNASTYEYNEDVNITNRVRNYGTSGLTSLVLESVVRNSGGTQVGTPANTTLASLGAGETKENSTNWNTNTYAEGTYTVFSYLYNNAGEIISRNTTTFEIYRENVTVNITANASSYNLSSLVAIYGNITSVGGLALNGTLNIDITNSTNDGVAGVTSRPVTTGTFYNISAQNLTWNTGTTPAGSYRVNATFIYVNETGSNLTTTDLYTFSITALENVTISSITTNSTGYQKGQDALITIAISNTGNENVTGNLSITITDSSGSPVSVNYHNNTWIPAGGSNSTQDINSTSDWEGLYNITARFSWGSESSQRSETFNVWTVTRHTLQIRLRINDVSGSTYIPSSGQGEKTTPSLSNGTFASPDSHYLASYSGGVMKALVYQKTSPVSITVNRSGSSEHILEINQYLNNSLAYLVFTQGDWNKIDQRLEEIEKGTFMSSIAPSFAYGLGSFYPIRIMIQYTGIDILGSPVLQKGYHNLVIENNGTVAGKVSVEVRKA